MNNITIINDCRDENAAGRQNIRVARLFGAAPSFIGVANELEAAGNLIDALDALDGSDGVVLVNVAPRGRNAKKWANGSPFGYFRFGKTLVVSTIDGLVLSLVKKFRLCDSVRVLDTARATDVLINRKLVPQNLKQHIIDSQFRSFDFLPRIAAYLQHDAKSTLGEPVSIDLFSNVPDAVWYVDNFGNCKTTLIAEEAAPRRKNVVTTKMGSLYHYERLRDVPRAQAALVTGSSGIGARRFLEVVIQGGAAAEYFHLAVGSRVK